MAMKHNFVACISSATFNISISVVTKSFQFEFRLAQGISWSVSQGLCGWHCDSIQYSQKSNSLSVGGCEGSLSLFGGDLLSV